MKATIAINKILIFFGILMFFNINGYPQDKKPTELRVKTSAICSQCKDRIEQGMAFEKGIKDVNLDVDTKIATIIYNPSKTNPTEIRTTISKLGYDADTIPAEKTAYEKLPPCCKKKEDTKSK